MGSSSPQRPASEGLFVFSHLGGRGFKFRIEIFVMLWLLEGCPFTGTFEELVSPGTATKLENRRTARTFWTTDRHLGRAFPESSGPSCVLATLEKPSGCLCAGREGHLEGGSSPVPTSPAKLAFNLSLCWRRPPKPQATPAVPSTRTTSCQWTWGRE